MYFNCREFKMLLFWFIFLAFVAVLLVLDLGVFHKKDRAMSVKESLVWTAVTVGFSLAFCGIVYLLFGSESAFEFLTGYVIEKALSIDNVFVMAAIFSYFKIPDIYQHRVLFWGVLGAIVLRGLFVLAGFSILQNFHWAFYIFGSILVVSAVKMLFQKDDNGEDLNYSRFVKIAGRIIPSTDKFYGHSFFAKVKGRLTATPLFLALVVIEFSDALFAMDSIPAIFAVTQDPFVVFTSNIMAILGMRSLYFAIAVMLKKFKHLKFALAFILVFVGAKMLLMDFVKIPILVSLGVILLAFILGLIWP